LIIVLFFALFMAIFVLGFVVEALKNPSPQSPRPAGGAHRVQGVR
jgi:hypothetical protein